MNGHTFQRETDGAIGTPFANDVMSCTILPKIQLGRFLSRHFTSNITIKATTLSEDVNKYKNPSPNDLKDHIVLSEKLKVCSEL